MTLEIFQLVNKTLNNRGAGSKFIADKPGEHIQKCSSRIAPDSSIKLISKHEEFISLILSISLRITVRLRAELERSRFSFNGQRDSELAVAITQEKKAR